MAIDRVAALDDPQLRAFVPLIYVAWSDFDLESEDRARVLTAMAAQPWLRPAARAVLDAWLEAPASAGDLAGFSALFEERAHGDLSLLVKVGVQYGLYGGAVWALGTARHHARLAEGARTAELGCFAMRAV